jgi:hypothetical protein
LSITFNRNFGPGVVTPSAPASVSAFRLDKYEVSVARFKAFVDYVQQNTYVPPTGSGKHSHIKDGTGKPVGLSLAEGGYENGWLASSFNLSAFITASTYPSAEPYPDGPLVEDESGASRARGSTRERRPQWQSRRQVG